MVTIFPARGRCVTTTALRPRMAVEAAAELSVILARARAHDHGVRVGRGTGRIAPGIAPLRISASQ
jgi:hypothetical protein